MLFCPGNLTINQRHFQIASDRIHMGRCIVCRLPDSELYLLDASPLKFIEAKRDRGAYTAN